MAFRDLILSNFRRKIFSFLLAILVWMTIHYADSRHRSASSTSQTNSVTNLQ